MPRAHLRWDTNASPVIPGQPPAAPGWVTSIAFDGGAVVSWDTSQGGGPVQSWVVTPFIAGVAQTATAGTGNGRATVTGLTNSTAYAFGVQVINQAGSALSPISGANTPLANLIFGDDFNGTVLDPSWVAAYRDGDQSNNEAQYYLPSQVSLDGAGHLLLTAVPGSAQTFPTYNDGNPPFYRGGPPVSRPYLSGFVQWAWPGALATGTGAAQAVSQFSQPGFNFTYGQIQVNAQLPDVSGSAPAGGWGAAWMLGSQCQQNLPYDPDNVGTCNWPSTGSEEIDIVEQPGGGAAGGQVVWAFNGNGGVNNNPGGTTVANQSTTYHTYEVDWAAGTLTALVDGSGMVGSPYSNAAVPANPMYLMIVNAMRPPVTGLSQPVMSVDWVRVFHN